MSKKRVPRFLRNVELGDGKPGKDGEDGAPGKEGPPGQDGSPGQDGADGVGISDISYDQEEQELVFDMSDSTEKRVEMPE